MPTSFADPPASSVLDTNPHLGHYIFKLVLSNSTGPTAAAQPANRSVSSGQHPLSVSSSGESDDEDDGDADDDDDDDDDDHEDTGRRRQQQQLGSSANSNDDDSKVLTNGRAPTGPSRDDREELVRKVINMLDNEQEEDVKDLLRVHMGVLGKDDLFMDQVCLDCMHRHRDDVSGMPYHEGSFTPTRARRPYTPTGVGTLRVRTPLARPHSPAQTGSGTQTPTSMAAPSALSHGLSGLSLGHVESAPSPALAPGAPAAPAPSSSSGYSSSGSPVSSPRVLNVKAAMFNPGGSGSIGGGGAGSVGSSAGLSSPPVIAAPTASMAVRKQHLTNISNTGNFSPSADPWRDAGGGEPAGLQQRPASPYMFGGGGAHGMVRTASNRAIIAPIISDQSSPFHSPLGTPTRSHMKLGDSFASPTALPRPGSRGVVPDPDDDDDEFSPFGTGLPKLHHHEPSGLNTAARPFEPFGSGGGGGHGPPEFYPSSLTPSSAAQTQSSEQSTSFESRSSLDPEDDPTQNATLGMTPLDVLSSVFSTVPRRDLEDALHRSGYDFEAAMAMLVAQYTHPRSGASTPQRIGSPRPIIGIDGRPVTLPSGGPAFFHQQAAGRGFPGGMGPALAARNASGNSNGPTRMCRYFLNGECRRSDCRFSHDLERALCRFWLRGHCAKGPNCEFLHNLPNNLDQNVLTNAMSRMDVDSPAHSHPGTPPAIGQYGAGDDFPDLLAARLNRHVGRFDPSRNRFANAVKRPAPAPPPVHITITGGGPGGGRFSPAPPQPYSPGGSESTAPAAPKVPVVPRASQRVKLRGPTLLPTLATGGAANVQYMAARSTSIRLGNARNACLARAADAFRRGDGAAAKRFSREGKALNEKMLQEANEAAQALVKERMRDAQKSVRERNPSWSDDPRDRAERGKECGGGLGVVLGVARVSIANQLSSGERTEALIDLHTLHGNEGADIAGQWLAELERENYRGLSYIVVGEEKHVGNQDPARGASKVRLGASVKQFLAEWGYAWNEFGGVLCVDPCR